ncbi:nuclear transport factor 2 family protein [Halomonas denitrificans]|nr:nuclear transport factor 2 family protein [Halomonas denitrificans]
MDAYRNALDTFPGSTAAIDDGLERFGRTFADLTADDVGERMRELYADRLYFNDTLVTLESSEAVGDYMASTGDKLQVSRVDVDHTLRDGHEVYVRWTMHFETAAFGMKVESNSVGMTHLRFDEAGRIVLHQDFWDAAGGLYEHLPIVGAMLRTARRMMK